MKKVFFYMGVIIFSYGVFFYEPELVNADSLAEVKTAETVVSATRTTRDLAEVPASVSLVTEQEIQRSGSTSIADLLKDIPGVEVSDQSLAGAKRINIRAESGARVLIMIDGQKISEQKSMDGAPLLIDPFVIQKIEVIKGPASVLYGSEAIGGAVNIITKKGGKKVFQAAGNIIYDSSTGGFTENVSAFGKYEKYNYRISGTHSKQGDRETPDGKLKESDSNMKNISGFFGYDTDKLAMGAGLEHYTSEVDSPPIMVGGSPFNLNLPEWSRNKADFFVDLKSVSSSLLKIHMDLYWQKVKKDFEQKMTLNMGPIGNYSSTMSTTNDQKSYGINTQADFSPADTHYIIFGYSFNHDKLDADSVVDFDYLGGRMLPPPPMGPPGPSTDPVLTLYKASISTHAIYLQDEWMLPSDFTLTIGGRQTWVRSELEDTNDPNVKKDKVNGSQPVFSFGVNWGGINNLVLRGLFSQGYRFPDLNKLFIGTAHGGSVTLANPDLDPEKSNNFEIGARFDNGKLKLDVAGFMNFAKDYITRRNIGAGVAKYSNVNKAETRGIEAYLAYNIKSVNLTPYLSATCMKRKYEGKNFSTWKTNTPQFSGRAGIKYETEFTSFPASLWVDMWMRASDKAEDEAFSGDVSTTSGWGTANFAIGSELGKKRNYSISLNVKNIFDKAYTTSKNALEEPGIHAVAMLGFKF
ncbi:MAG: hypothetical protein CSA18_02020 [Deltaproteobacteria bacterium]|nr:MAG: hypothetical protein CSB21_01445 [Deltaproteobacteria bacterium]PIE74914.1 MAG: hypothetical protein CSA18_02020 [Deltaproteobacteria bacterium]